jgi:peptidoglycan/LPS O-acetylase OafA/YrhL
MFIHKIKEFIVRTFTVKIDSSRIFGLDLLRFFAIAFVVISHGLHYLPYTDFFLNFMLDGVTLFFVLSGFLIGGILIEILNRNAFGRKELLNFWIRRWCRTLPAYFLVLLVLLLLETFFIRDFSIYEGLKYFLFIQNFASPHPEFFAEAWSLSIEEWFYLLVPVFLYGLINILKQSVKTSVLIVIISIILFATLFRCYRYVNGIPQDLNMWDLHFRKQVITRLDSLMYGVLGAYIKYYYSKIWNGYKNVLLWIGLGLIVISQLSFIGLISDVDDSFFSIFSFSVMSIGTLFLLPFLSSYRIGPRIISLPVTYISLISYSMYLVNLTFIQTWIIGKMFVYRNIFHYFISSVYTLFSTYLVLCYMISFFLYKYFEVPTTRLRDKLKIK